MEDSTQTGEWETTDFTYTIKNSDGTLVTTSTLTKFDGKSAELKFSGTTSRARLHVGDHARGWWR